MEDNNVIKWTAASVGVILVCFCLGYFVLGPSRGSEPAAVIAESTPDASANGARISPPSALPANSGLQIDEKTDEIEEKKRKADEAKKQKAEDEKKKADQAAAEKAAADAAAANATPSPDPNGSPSPDPDATPSAADATPDPNAAPTPDAAPKGGSKGSDTAASDEPYRVHVGSFGARDGAKALAAELNGRGYSASVVKSGDGFQVQVGGSFREKKSAEDQQKELKANGYDASVDH